MGPGETSGTAVSHVADSRTRSIKLDLTVGCRMLGAPFTVSWGEIWIVLVSHVADRRGVDLFDTSVRRVVGAPSAV